MRPQVKADEQTLAQLKDTVIKLRAMSVTLESKGWKKEAKKAKKLAHRYSELFFKLGGAV